MRSVGEIVWRNGQPPGDQAVVPVMPAKEYDSQRVLCYFPYTSELTEKQSIIVSDVHIFDARNVVTAVRERN